MPSGLISMSSGSMGAIRMEATCGSKAIVERPWKEDDQSIEVSLASVFVYPGDCKVSEKLRLGVGWSWVLLLSGMGTEGRGPRDGSTSSTVMMLGESRCLGAGAALGLVGVNGFADDRGTNLRVVEEEGVLAVLVETEAHCDAGDDSDGCCSVLCRVLSALKSFDDACRSCRRAGRLLDRILRAGCGGVGVGKGLMSLEVANAVCWKFQVLKSLRKRLVGHVKRGGGDKRWSTNSAS